MNTTPSQPTSEASTPEPSQPEIVPLHDEERAFFLERTEAINHLQVEIRSAMKLLLAQKRLNFELNWTLSQDLTKLVGTQQK